MVASRTASTTTGRIPALGLRVVLLVLASIALMVLDHRMNHLDSVRRTVGVVTYPLQIVVDSPFRLWSWLRDGTAARSDMQLELSRLRAERLITNARLQRMTALEAENARLRDLLDARSQVRDDIRVAEIMSVEASPFLHSVVIDVGSNDGAYTGQAIVDAEGVVAQIIHTGHATSQALLISDANHSLPVEVNRNGLRTIANGTGVLDQLALPFLPNNADIRPGDLLVTSGLGGTFPAGYPVATVTDVTRIPQEAFADVTATPTARLDQVREVMLIWSAEQEPREPTATAGGNGAAVQDEAAEGDGEGDE